MTSRFTLVQSARVTLAMGWSDFVLRYRASVLGYLWALAAPLARFVVILFVFQSFVGDSIAHYPFYLFLGVIFWEYFVQVTRGSFHVIFQRADLIQKVAFPRVLLLFAVSWTELIVLASHLSLFFVLAVLFDIPLSFSALYVLLVIFQMTLLTLGIGMFLASFILRFRDIDHMWTLALQVLFWLTPIFYRYDLDTPLTAKLHNTIVGEWSPSLFALLEIFVTFQPLSVLLHDARRALLYAETIGIPSVVHSAALTVLCLVTFFVGYATFRVRSPFFVQEY